MAAYFLPSFFQKRLLRYALSRLELVDTDALDLDSLGIKWGQRSTFELKDISLRLEKLSSLLRLPPTCSIENARVSLLRVTIPADIYNSGIIVEVDGVHTHLRFATVEPPVDGEDHSHLSKEDKANRPRSSHSDIHDPGGDYGNIIPSPTDLAQSFLESEPREEKAELEAAISSQSHHFQQPDVVSDDGEEELGLHDGVSLPSFIAGFLKGVVDRLQLKVTDTTLRIDMDIRQDEATRRSTDSALDPITGLFTVQDITVNGIASPTSDTPLVDTKLGKRQIIISQIHAMLVADPGVFAKYSLSSAANPPSAPESPSIQSKLSHTPIRIPSPSPTTSASSSSLAMSQSTILNPTIPFHDSHSRSMEQSIYSADGRFSDADEYDHDAYGHSIYESQYHEDMLDNPAYLEQVLNSHLDDDVHNSSPLAGVNENISGSWTSQAESSSSAGVPENVRPDHSSDKIELEGSHISDRPESSRSLISQDPTGDVQEDDRSTACPRSPSATPLEQRSSPGSDAAESISSDRTPNCELSESRLYTHEEAESMYMSAMSSTSYNAESVPHMPGGWGSPKSVASKNDRSSPVLDSSHRSSIAAVSVGQAEGDSDMSTPTLKPLDAPHPQGTELEGSSETLDGSRLSYHAERGAPDQQSDDVPSSSQEYYGVAKKILEIDSITIWLPSSDSETEEPINATAEAERPGEHSDHMKESLFSLSESRAYESSHRGSKSHHSARISFKGQASSTPLNRLGPASAPHYDDDISDPTSDKKGSSTAEVDIANVSITFDIACGWLVTKMVHDMVTTWDRHGRSDKSTSNQNSSTAMMPLSLSLSSCSIKLLDHLQNHPYHRAREACQPLDQAHLDIASVIIYATASGLGFQSSKLGDKSTLRFNVSKFVLGHGSHEILSFDESFAPHDYSKDKLSPPNPDISLLIQTYPETSVVELKTLTARLSLNIQQLDEALGWFGGLSTILELGSSIASISTVKEGKSSIPQRSRGVHFEPVPAPTSKAPSETSRLWKLNCRIGGFVADVIGEQCSLVLKTSTVKVIGRSEGIGLQISGANLSGPFVYGASSSDLTNIKVTNIRAEYLFSPKEGDIDRLLSLLTPSKDKYEEDNDIMLHTLVRQRKDGAVFRLNIGNVAANIPHLEPLALLADLGKEMTKLSTVAKYLPEDDRPGVLVLGLISELQANIHIGNEVGDISINTQGLEAAFVSMPSLMAARITNIGAFRNDSEELIGTALDVANDQQDNLPMVMAKFIPDEMEPTIRVKFYNTRVEYNVPSIMAFLGLSDQMTVEDVAANMATSVINVAEHHVTRTHLSARSSMGSEISKGSPPSRLAVAMRDCVVGLNPRKSPAKGLLVFTQAKFFGAINKEGPSEATLDIKKASILIIDDVQNIGLTDSGHRRRSNENRSSQVQTLRAMGYVSVCELSSAKAYVKVMQLDDFSDKSLDVEIRDELLVLETCADSTQTLLAILSGLVPPTPPSTALKYRTQVMPIEDLLASFSGNAFPTEPLVEPGTTLEHPSAEGSRHDDGISAEELEYVSDFFPAVSSGDPFEDPNIDSPGQSKGLLDSFYSHANASSSIAVLNFQDDHFARKSSVEGTAHRWDSGHNTYGLADDVRLQDSPLRVRVRDVHVIWNLFDGYDWQRTRDTISKAVKDVQSRAMEKRARAESSLSPGLEDDGESVIGDFLFNSIYIGIPANRDPRELAGDINRNIDDLVSETGSYATSTTTVTGTNARTNPSSGAKGKRLRLSRSKRHKMSFELKGVSADLVVFPPGSGETQSSLDIRVNDLEIFDHVPTSTWRKFATYMRDAGEREAGTSMVHLEILNVKPVADLAASELVVKATVLPLRLHVDQDALDFLSRFFEFKDDRAAVDTSPNELPFLQRVEVNAVQVRLDFKPKRIDYAGLRSGRTTEFMNIFILDGADMVLRHVIIYGVSGFEKLGNTLNDIWMPDIKRNQLPRVLAGLSPIKSIANVGGGFKDLVVVPMREYRKDGRIFRSIQMGALSFAKTTTNELVRFGAKLAIGTQAVLENAEGFFNTTDGRPPTADDRWDDETIEEEEKERISLYANQPVGVAQGIRSGFARLERDLLMARDAVVAVPGEVLDSRTPGEATRAMMKHAPTVILRPAIGASRAIGQTLLGAANTLDPQNRRRAEEKYKRH
ncbi:hypothetical protein AJ80_06564 [Polytolypa hystricis UAMH7299]|uniref:Autophagy-related protein 2 n=1 Tax=Polytolypa hystricis (strain UAMH7299) TaxID=1447883 RepID=A0A2B7XV84_POLH7|nr:hypothetical protein AJ80_06564 [Polytolypa hystricis UAMH7299]